MCNHTMSKELLNMIILLTAWQSCKACALIKIYEKHISHQKRTHASKGWPEAKLYRITCKMA
jgi:hypothetical protein